MSPSVRSWLRALGVATALWAAAAPAMAQEPAPTAPPPDTLPALEEPPALAPEAPVLAPAAPVEAPPESAPDMTVIKDPAKLAKREQGPIRAQRRLALLGEVGWNGIAGFGPNLVWNVHPHVSFDFGAGLSLLGWKVGARARYNFLTGRVTPFVGIGGMHGGGFNTPIELSTMDDDPSREKLNVKIRQSAWLQTVGGVDWIAPSGFTLIGTTGYAFLLSHDPVEVVTGTPTAQDEEAFDVAFRSNIVITVALGYTFR